MELGYVERRYPLTGEPPSARAVHYDLSDPLLRFWFRFVFPNTSSIRHMAPPTPTATSSAPTWTPGSANASSASAAKPSPGCIERKE